MVKKLQVVKKDNSQVENNAIRSERTISRSIKELNLYQESKSLDRRNHKKLHKKLEEYQTRKLNL